MATMRTAHCGNISGVPRGREPVVDRGANLAPLDRRLARTMVAGDQQHHALAPGDRLIEAAIDGVPGSVEVHAVKIDDPVGSKRAAAQPLVPAAVESPVGDRSWRACRRRRQRRWRGRSREFRWSGDLRPFLNQPANRRFSRQRPDRRRNSGPELGLVRAERAHATRPPWGSGSALRPRPTSRRRSRRLPGRLPRMCRTGSAP